MKAEDLKPGTFYRIVAAVPKHAGIDKRVNSDWRKMPLKPGARLICQEAVERDRGDKAALSRIELVPYAGLAGQQYDSLYRVIAGWKNSDGGFVKRDADGDNAVLDVLLDVIEPDTIHDCDDALALFNAMSYGSATYYAIDWREVALHLLYVTDAPTMKVFRDVAYARAQIEKQAGDDQKKYDAMMANVAVVAYKPEKQPRWRVVYTYVGNSDHSGCVFVEAATEAEAKEAARKQVTPRGINITAVTGDP